MQERRRKAYNVEYYKAEGRKRLSQYVTIYVTKYMSCLFKVCLRGSLVFHKIMRSHEIGIHHFG